MFGKVLIANRGEIACRIARALREAGIRSVALYYEADRDGLQVRLCDEAYVIGPAASAESYLRIPVLLETAKRSGAEAIHPGYGFLAENAAFAAACQESGLAFIGPPPTAVALMGDKARARAVAVAAGVPVVPGSLPLPSLDAAEREADRIGYPLLVKATAGGGGKGMREVKSIEEMPAMLDSARREAESAFGDGNVYLEKLVEGARHIEIQILADEHGNVIHLGERECSLQRRHQKLLEEAPSPFILNDEGLRAKLGDVAVKAAAAVDYVNAGTIEFLMDKDQNYFFLEMNTRLQVEHPVTEFVTGIDIVKEQIRIARGRPLRFDQEDVTMNGWSIECRINAEDPYNNFLPSTGTITHSIQPNGPGVRVDTGIYPGFEITPYYDSLISKLIVWGETRGQAILRMRRALAEYKIIGVRTNIPFHQNLLEQHRFIAGQFDTRFVEDRFSMEEAEEEKEMRPEIAALIATVVAHRQAEQATQIVQRNARDTSNWKWVGRWERMHR